MKLLAPALLGALSLAAGGPVNSSRPAVIGTLQVGRQLVASPGGWSGAGTITYAYQWYRCAPLGSGCSSIHGATKGTYREVASDAGMTLGLTVRASDGTGTTTAYAALAGLVAPATAHVAAAKQPSLTGDAIVGRELQAGLGTFTAPAAVPAYSWLRCNVNGRLCTRIPGATAASYTPTKDDVGHVVLAALATSGRTVLSLSLGPVRAKPGPVDVVAPSVTGMLRRGSKLTASAGTWSGSGTIVYAYQWYRCDTAGAHCAAIRGATRGTYTQVARDVGKTLGVTVRATDTTGATAAYAPLAGVVAAANTFAAASQPALAGVPTVGRTLTVTGGTWSEPPTSLVYAWLRCNANGRLCAPIAGATAAGYTSVLADVGHTLVATVTATAGTVSATALTVASAVVSSG
jgi:hypothetical protein